MSNQTDTTRKTKHVIRQLERYLGIPVRNSSEKTPDPLDMLIATLLSQNTNDTNSYRAWKNLKEKYPTYESMYRARTGSIENAIRSGGMAKQKAARIKSLLKSVKKKYGSFSLKSLEKKSDELIQSELTAIDGIGLKTASCVMLFSLGRDSFPVDTHVHRILNRLGIVKTASPDKTFYSMQSIVPPAKMYSFHTNLIRFGREVCKAQNPHCYRCPLIKECSYKEKNIYTKLPNKDNRGDGKKRDFMLLDNV